MYDNHITGKATEASYIWFFLYRISDGVIPAAVWDNIRTGLQSRNSPFSIQSHFQSFPLLQKTGKGIRSSLPRLHFLHYLVRKDIIWWSAGLWWSLPVYSWLRNTCNMPVRLFPAYRYSFWLHIISGTSILYQEHRISNFFARLRHNARYTYVYHFTLGVLYNGSMEKISFCTNYYNHRIDRMFNNRLDSMGLYEYISNRFPDSEESGFWYFDILKAFS